jgi:hypothetical protein
MKKWTLNEKFEDTKESVNLRKTDNTMAKRKGQKPEKDKQRSTKHYTEN